MECRKVTDLSPWYEARELVVGALIADLHGSSTDAEITERPLRRFIVGILHPRSSTTAGTSV